VSGIIAGYQFAMLYSKPKDKINMRYIIRRLTLQQTLPYILIFGGLIGAIASLTLTYDKLQVLQNPAYDPACNINPIFSCGSVMLTEQASLLGVPNTIFGLAAFSALITFGIMLLAGSRPKRWLWQAAQMFALAGVVFMHYLFFQSAFRIMAICIWCFATWVVTIPIFWYLTLYNLRESNITLPNTLKSAGNFAQKHHADILVIWYIVILLVLLKQFWYYWSTLL
jgi:uncharacterized membrane protein